MQAGSLPVLPPTSSPASPLHDGASAAFDDGQILQITHAANVGEIDQARMAQTKAQDPRVKAFAEMMIRYHGDADAKGREIGQKEGLTMTASSASMSIEKDGKEVLFAISSQTSKGFDKAYMDAQIKEHQSLLDLLDQTLITSARSPSLRAHLQSVRQTVDAHLKEARATDVR